MGQFFKKFLTVFAGSFAAIWVTIALGCIFFFFTLGMILASASQDTDTEIRKHSILHIDLSLPIAERYQSQSLRDVLLSGSTQVLYLNELLQAVNTAATDERIDGIYLDCGGTSAGYATLQELAGALAKFKSKSKKWIVAYGDEFTQADYYLASCADSLIVNPVGAVSVTGVASQMPFFKDALDKLGIEMQVFKVGQFKSAVEPFLLNEPSEPSKLQTQVMLDAIWGNVTNTIARGRNVDRSKVNAWADSMIVMASAETLLKQQVVTGTAYRQQFENRLRKMAGVDKDDPLPLVSAHKYVADKKARELASIKKSLDELQGKDHIAVYYAMGEIVDGGDDGIVGKKMVDDLLDLAKDDNVRGLVLRVNSPGGSAFASEQIWQAEQEFLKTGKPLYVSMGDYAASGGYYIACSADRIFADANTLTGSIGIYGMVPCAKGLVTDKLGVNFVTVETNPGANFPSLFSPMTEPQKAAMQSSVERGYKLFTTRVAQGRGLKRDSVLTIAEGRVWDGRAALKIGLVDELGGIDATVAAMAKKLKMSPSDRVDYPRIIKTPWDEIFENIDGIGAPGFDFAAALPIEEQCRQLLQRLTECKTPLQARMPYIYLR